MKAKDKDFYRWLVYGIILLVLSLASFKWHSAFWLFLVALVISVGDILYTQYTKYIGQ